MTLISKRAIRCLGIAESFVRDSKISILAGIVMRGDLIVDGVTFTKITLGGLDATDGVAKIFKNLGRNDINIIMIGGAIIALYNIIDIEELYRHLTIPIICITYKESKGIERNLKRLPNADKRIEIYRRLGARKKITLKTGYSVFARWCGLSEKEVKVLLNKFTRFGRVPEPIRVARLCARSVLKFIFANRLELQ
ncbi:MAG: DUF99 domain-containing protein [Thermoprotei archaeon]|nr:MAG: DUF99 domain-containing protein [Thermoprotei archaeon]